MKRFLQWISVPIGLWLLGFAIDEFEIKWFNKRIGALIWCVLIWMFLHVRQDKDRLVGIGLAMLFIFAYYILPSLNFYGERLAFQKPDAIANRTIGHAFSQHYAQKIPVLWNPYIFCGMPSYLQLFWCSPTFGWHFVLGICKSAFPFAYLYGVLRLSPGKVEQKIFKFRFLQNDLDNILVWVGIFLSFTFAYAMFLAVTWLVNMYKPVELIW